MEEFDQMTANHRSVLRNGPIIKEFGESYACRDANSGDLLMRGSLPITREVVEKYAPVFVEVLNSIEQGTHFEAATSFSTEEITVMAEYVISRAQTAQNI